MNVFDSPERRAQQAGDGKRCNSCGEYKPRTAFSADRSRFDGLRPQCNNCRREQRGPRGRERQQARRLAVTLESLSGAAPSDQVKAILGQAAADLLALAETSPRDAKAQASKVRRAVVIGGCREISEIMEETALSRWIVEQSLRRLVADGVVEERSQYRNKVDEEEGEAGAPPTEYHPCDTPAGDSFLTRRGAGQPAPPDVHV